ncbi:MAG: T9SS type A sorting domain-containing protein, partial [Bacteroidota bacterium]
WTVVPAANLPVPVSGEFGVVGYYSAVGDNIWFGTNKGRVYRSTDKGYTWEVSTTTITGKYVDVEFATTLHGIAQDKDAATIGAMSETFDGGATWQAITSSGPVFTNDYVYVPGTENTWVTTGADATTPAMGVSYSFDGGHTWTLFPGTDLVQYLSTDWVNNSIGWAGSFSVSATEGGMYKFTGVLQPTEILSAPENVQAVTTGMDAYITWDAPASVPVVLGYNVYRNGELLTIAPITDMFYSDAALENGNYDYCITAVYEAGESVQVCATAYISVDIKDLAEGKVSVFPNPASAFLNIDSYKPFISVEMLNFAGQVVYSNAFNGHHMQIATSAFEPGMYLVRIKTVDGLTIRKISVK